MITYIQFYFQHNILKLNLENILKCIDCILQMNRKQAEFCILKKKNRIKSQQQSPVNLKRKTKIWSNVIRRK